MTEYAKLPVNHQYDYDVVVCGGGVSGFCAAVAAARGGVRTCLIERYGMIGGTMTLGGISAPALFYSKDRQVIKGIGWELMERLSEMGYADIPKDPFGKHSYHVIEINAFAAGLVMDRMLREAGVDTLLHRTVVGASHQSESQEKYIECIFVSSEKGMDCVTGKVFIDCTGDAVLSTVAGAEMEKNDELQPGTLSAVFDHLDFSQITTKELAESYHKALREGKIKPEDMWKGKENPNAIRTGRGRGQATKIECRQNPGLNLNHVYPLDSTDNNSRTAAEMAGRESLFRILNWLRTDVAGCEHANIVAVAPYTASRESCRVIGEAYITGDDYINGVVPKDAICYSYYTVDIHQGNAENHIYNEKIVGDQVPGIPYGALVAKTFSNLLIAGRIISGDRRASSAYRVEATCMATGEAAGTAASIAVSTESNVQKIKIEELKKRLKDAGAIVPE